MTNVIIQLRIIDKRIIISITTSFAADCSQVKITKSTEEACTETCNQFIYNSKYDMVELILNSMITIHQQKANNTFKGPGEERQ